MCLPKPYPRCSNHSRARYSSAKEKLAHAEQAVKDSAKACKTSHSAAVKSQMLRDERALKSAKKTFRLAKENYDRSVVNRDEAMDKFKKARLEYLSSPEGIQKLSEAGKNIEAAKMRDYREKRLLAVKESVESNKIDVDSLDYDGQQKFIASLRDQKLLSKLAVHSSPHIRKYVAENECISGEVATLLAKDADYSTRQIIASNKNLTLEAAKQLSKDSQMQVRINLASNEKTPLEVLRNLARDRATSVKREVAGNPMIDEELAYSSVSDGHEEVRLSLAGNPATSLKLQNRLSDHLREESAEVRNRIIARPDLKASQMDYFEETAPHVLAKNRYLPQEYQNRLAKSSDDNVREALAANKKISKETMEILVDTSDNESFAPLRLVLNDDTPRHILERITNNPKLDPEAVRLAKKRIAEEIR